MNLSESKAQSKFVLVWSGIISDFWVFVHFFCNKEILQVNHLFHKLSLLSVFITVWRFYCRCFFLCSHLPFYFESVFLILEFVFVKKKLLPIFWLVRSTINFRWKKYGNSWILPGLPSGWLGQAYDSWWWSTLVQRYQKSELILILTWHLAFLILSKLVYVNQTLRFFWPYAVSLLSNARHVLFWFISFALRALPKKEFVYDSDEPARTALQAVSNTSC